MILLSPELSPDPVIAGVQSRLYKAIKDSGRFPDRESVRVATGIRDRHLVGRVLEGKQGPKAMISPKHLRTLRAISVALGQEEFYLEGGPRPEDESVPLGSRVLNARLNRALSLQTAALKADINPAIWHRLEYDPTYPPLASERTMGGVQRVLGISMKY